MFMITGIGVHDRTVSPFTITGIRSCCGKLSERWRSGTWLL